MVRRVPNRRDRRPHENGCPKNKRARRSTSDQEEDSNSDDEREVAMLNEMNKKTNGEVEVAPAVKPEEDILEQADQKKPRDTQNETGLTNGGMVGDDSEQNKEICHINEEVKKETSESEQSETKPYTESPKPYIELPAQSSVKTEQVSVTMTTTESNEGDEQKPNIKSESSQPAVDVPAPQPVKRTC